MIWHSFRLRADALALTPLGLGLAEGAMTIGEGEQDDFAE
jgi:hypothetical protein